MSEEKEKPDKKEVREIPLDQLDVKGEKTVGEILLAARESAGLNLDAVSLDTKIPRKSLEYLETDNFEALPAKVYVRGFLRTYAGILGLDVAYLLNKYEVQTGQDHKSRGDHWEIEETLVEETLESPMIFKRFIIPAAVLIVVIAVIWIVMEISGGDSDNRAGVLTGETIQAQDQVKDQDKEAPEEAGGGQSGTESQGESDGGPGAGQQKAVSPPEEAEKDKAAEPAKKKEQEPIELKITANRSDTTWFDLVIYTEVDSKPDSVLREFILYPGQQEVLHATDSFLFKTIGNAGGFSMERNGVSLPSLGERGRVRKNIRITRDGVFRE